MTNELKPARATIFVIDDDADSREVFGALLRAHGFDVEDFESAEAALSAMVSTLPAIVVTDITLAFGIDGYEAAKRIRALPAGRDVHLVAMTGHSAAKVRKQADVFEAILTKPVDLDALIVVLNGLLRETATPAHA